MVKRRLAKDDGTLAGSLEPIAFTPEGSDRIRCQTFLDAIPVSNMRPGPYRFEVDLDPPARGSSSQSRVRFVVPDRSAPPARAGSGAQTKQQPDDP
jgi:hypothetical protein